MNKPRSALIVGGAKCAFHDYQLATKQFQFDTVITVNEGGIRIPEVDHYVTAHPEVAYVWLNTRREMGLPDPKRFWTSKEKRTKYNDIEFEHIGPRWAISSITLAVQVARYLKYDRKVLCGVVLDAYGYNDPEKDDVRCMSGVLRERFGEPTYDWMNL